MKLALDILELIMKSKKKVLGVFSGCFKTYTTVMKTKETCTRYSRIDDREQKESLRRFLWSFFRKSLGKAITRNYRKF